MTELRVGIIGLGVGEQHIAGYEAHPGARVTALCDMDEARLAEVSARHPGRRLFTDAAELIADPDLDVVSIASYDSSHFEQVTAALHAGRHVFVEKPMCLRRTEADELWRLWRQRPELRLSSNVPLRMSPRFAQLRDWIAAGRLGELYYVEGDYDYGRLWKLTEGWRGDEPFYSVVLGGAVHMVDLLLWLTGRRVVEVCAQGSHKATVGTKFAYDDLVLASLTFDDGTIGKVSANFAIVHPHFHTLKVCGTKGTFVNRLGDAELWTSSGADARPEAVSTAYPGIHKGDLLHSFVESIVSGARAVAPGEDVFETMAVLFAIEEAAASGERVQVRPFDYPRTR
jgi:predicted dehydrogenase